jgi:hypothetical protein
VSRLSFYNDKTNLFADDHDPIVRLAYTLTNQPISMRYSRMLEESSFANRKADYFWLLFLSSLMLLVRLSLPPSPSPFHSHPFIPGPIPTLQPPLSLLPTRLRAHLLLVPPTPINAHITFRPADNHSTLPPFCTRGLLLGAHWHVARCGERSRWVCSGPRRVVHS